MEKGCFLPNLEILIFSMEQYPPRLSGTHQEGDYQVDYSPLEEWSETGLIIHTSDTVTFPPAAFQARGAKIK